MIRIGPGAPRSRVDGFRLRLARARADAVLTTGANLRAEPALRHTLDGEGAAELVRHRREQLGRSGPPESVVLTRGQRLDPAHPLWLGPRPVRVLVPRDGAEAARRELAARGAVIETPERAGLPGALHHLRSRSGTCTVCIEAGPATARHLYRAALLADELLLSIFLAPELDARHLVAPFASPHRIRALFGEPVERTESEEESGRWRFERYRRRPAP